MILHSAVAAAGGDGAPGLVVVLGTAALAGLLALLFWGLLGHLITAAHEGGHALAAAAQGAPVGGVKLRRNRTGLTETGSAGWLGDIVVKLTGYSAPPFFGVLGSMFLAHDRPAPVLWITFGGLVLLFLVAANWFGRFVLALFAFLFFLAAARTSSAVQLVIACTWNWLLLFGGLGIAVQHGADGGDQNDLRDMTFVPATLWAWLFNVFAVVALGYGGLLLVGAVRPPW